MAGLGTVGVETVEEDGTTTSVVTTDVGNAGEDYSLTRSEGETALGLRFTLNQATTTTGPTLLSWQLKAQPAVRRQRIIRVPILLFENMRATKGTALPPVDVHDVLAQLEDLE